MSDPTVEASQWGVVQFFLDAKTYRIYEVQTNKSNKNFRCTCSDGGNRDCKHLTFVKRRVDPEGGYAVTVSGNVTAEDIATAQSSHETMRKFVLTRVKIEVI